MTRNKNAIETKGLLSKAIDWKLQVDIGERLVFPADIAETAQRPDMVITSRSTKTLILVELTVPWEDRIEVSHELKQAKYDDLVTQARQNGWHATCFSIEAGCRGFPAKSVSWMLKTLGIPSTKRKKAIVDVGRMAERSSRWIWLKRDSCWLPQV